MSFSVRTSKAIIMLTSRFEPVTGPSSLFRRDLSGKKESVSTVSAADYLEQGFSGRKLNTSKHTRMMIK